MTPVSPAHVGSGPRFVPRPTIRRHPALQARLDAKPSAQTRRATAPKPPGSVENLLAIAARRLVRGYLDEILPIALAAVDDLAKPEPADDAERTDADDGLDKAREAAGLARQNAAKAKKISSYMREVARRAVKRGLPAFEARSKVAADRAQKHSKRELGRLGLVVKKEPELKHLISGWRRDNVERITGLADEHVKRIEEILAAGFAKRPETLAREIKALGIMGDRRAELIARDQVLTLNSNINRSRQQAAGVTQFLWVTQNDPRVRDSHAVLDGRRFSWSKGHPDEGFPGTQINCRCLAAPIPPKERPTDDED